LVGGIELSLGPLPALANFERVWTRIGAGERAGFFTSWNWIGTWLKNLPPGLEPLALQASVEGQPVALAVVVRRRSRRRWLIPSRALYLNATGTPEMDCVTIEHNGFVAPAELQPKLWRALLDWFERERLDADELYIGGVTWPLDQGNGSRHPLQSSTVTRRGYLVDLASLAEVGGDLAERLSRNARSQLQRAIRTYTRYGELRLDEADTVERALAYFEELKRLHIQSWTRRRKPHSFINPFFETFHKSLIREGLPKGQIQLLSISVGDWKIGYLYNFRYNGRVYAYQSGFDDRDNRWRPGYVSHYLAIKHSFQAGMQVYDLLAGDNRLKESFATGTYEMFWHRIYRPLLVFRVEQALHIVKNRYLPRFSFARRATWD
jgi:CelD/BcsL family acetyltransferase involved in cellulose biosynthesis